MHPNHKTTHVQFNQPFPMVLVHDGSVSTDMTPTGVSIPVLEHVECDHPSFDIYIIRLADGRLASVLCPNH